VIHLPRLTRPPLQALAIRAGAAVGLVLFVTIVVYIDRDGYHDINEDGLSLLDCFYYTVVSLSTTGYGDISPVSPSARLVNVLIVAPARVLFLIILVGTTIQVLTDQYRNSARLSRWRKTVKDHVIVCGYGTKGRAAVRALIENGLSQSAIVVVEQNRTAVRQAVADGLVAIEGSASSSEVLKEAGVKLAKNVIIATDNDEAAVLVTLTARQLTAGKVRIVAAAREAENASLLRQSGAHHVVVSSSTAGRLMGLSTTAPPLIDVVEDLLTPGAGMALAMRSATRDEVGRSPREMTEVVIALARRGQIMSLAAPGGEEIETGDMLVYIRDERPATARA
jgi:voltage-gated potassium channel